jgi:hypothetical protein
MTYLRNILMQLKWNSTTTYPNIVEKKLVLQRKYPKLCIISLYIMYVTNFYKKLFFIFLKRIIKIRQQSLEATYKAALVQMVYGVIQLQFTFMFLY